MTEKRFVVTQNISSVKILESAVGGEKKQAIRARSEHVRLVRRRGSSGIGKGARAKRERTRERIVSQKVLGIRNVDYLINLGTQSPLVYQTRSA